MCGVPTDFLFSYDRSIKCIYCGELIEPWKLWGMDGIKMKVGVRSKKVAHEYYHEDCNIFSFIDDIK